MEAVRVAFDIVAGFRIWRELSLPVGLNESKPYSRKYQEGFLGQWRNGLGGSDRDEKGGALLPGRSDGARAGCILRRLYIWGKFCSIIRFWCV